MNFRERDVRAFLAGLAIAAGGLACSRPTDRPQPSTRPPAAGAPPRDNLAPKPGELNIKGWQHFGSNGYPYEINYPKNWIETTRPLAEVEGKDDSFEEPDVTGRIPTLVKIKAEPLKQPTTLEALERERGDALNKAIISTRRELKKEPGDSHVQTTRLKIDGRDGFMLKARHFMPDPQIRAYREYDLTRVVFLEGNRAWNIDLRTDPSATEGGKKMFQQMLESFKITGITADLVPYQSDRLPYAINRPRDWAVDNNDTFTIKREPNGFTSRLTIAMKPVDRSTNLASYRDKLVAEHTRQIGPASGPKINQVKIGTYDGETISMKGTVQNARGNFIKTFFLAGGYAWELTLELDPTITSETGSYFFVKVLPSFRLVK